MRQTPGGTGDTALQTPSWGPEVEGGSQDVRAIPSLIPAPVSLPLVVAWGDTATLGTPSTGAAAALPAAGGDPRRFEPSGRGSSKDQVPGEQQ